MIWLGPQQRDERPEWDNLHPLYVGQGQTLGDLLNGDGEVRHSDQFVMERKEGYRKVTVVKNEVKERTADPV